MSNSNYIRLQDLVIDTFNLDAPVEIEKGALLLASTSKTVLLQLRLNVLDNVNEISSTSLNIYGFTDSGEPVEGFSPFITNFSDVYLQGKKTFGDRTPIIVDPRIRKVKVEIDKVVFRSGNVWRHPEGYFTPPTQKPVSSIKGELQPQFERETRRLSETEKQNFKYIPQEFDVYWSCTCGRPNTNDSETCVRCGLSKSEVFNLTEEALQQSLDVYDEQLRLKAENERKQEEEKARLLEVKRARMKKKLPYVLAAVLLVLLAVLFRTYAMPAIRYSQASKHLTNKDYDYAIYIYDSLGDYRDSKTMVFESNYQKANDFLSEKKYDDAIKTFSYIREYRDSGTLMLEAKYQKALNFLENNEYGAAIVIISELGDYKTSQELSKEANYQKAIDLLSSKQFDESILLFSELNNYKDSAEKVVEARYQKACVLLANKDFDEAITVFTEVKEFLDSKELIKESKYQKGVGLFEKGDYSNAYNTLEPISDYKDTNSFVLESLYILGNQDFTAKRYEQAKERFFQLQDYKDSRNLYEEASYLLAQILVRDSKFLQAMDLFRQLGDYKDSQSLYNEASYLLAQKHIKDGAYIQAKALFEKLGHYKDSELFTKYVAAVSDYLAGKFTEAKQAFSSMGDFQDSKSYLEKTKVLIGIQGTWGYSGEGDYIGGGNSNMYFVFIGWRMFEIDAGNNVHEHERIIPDQVTASSMTINRLTYTLSSNSLIIVGFYDRTGADQPCYKISNTTNNAKILELLKK